MGVHPLACKRKSCIFRAPRTHGFDTLPSAQPAVDKGSTCCRFVAGQRAGLVRVDGGRGAPRSQEHRVLIKLFHFVVLFDNHARAKIRQVVNPPESPRRGCRWSARRCPRSSEVASLVNTQTPKTRRAVIAILAPAKTSFPGLVCHSVGLVVQGCQFTALFTKHALLGFASN